MKNKKERQYCQICNVKLIMISQKPTIAWLLCCLLHNVYQSTFPYLYKSTEYFLDWNLINEHHEKSEEILLSDYVKEIVHVVFE